MPKEISSKIATTCHISKKADYKMAEKASFTEKKAD
jgi:hypothetical protein